MTQIVDQMLRRFGQPVERVENNICTGEGFALLQAIEDKKRQLLPSPLGVARQDCLLYIGSANLALCADGTQFLRMGGAEYDIQNAHLVSMGAEPSHWRAVLSPREEAAV